MATRPLGTGYDPNSGWPPDDSTSIPYEPDVDLTGYGNFGPGGFAGNPKLTGPATGPPPGMSLSGPSGARGPASAGGPQYYGPQNPPLRNPPAVRAGPGPFTDVTSNVTPGMWDRIKGILPGILAGAGPAAVPALAVGGAAAGTWAEPRTPRIDPRISAAGTGGFDVEQPLGGATQPQHPSTMRYPMWPSGAAPAPTPMPARPYTPTPAPVVAPPVTNRPQDRPSYAGPVVTSPAAAKQKPNLGSYMIDRPNMPAGQQGGRGGPSQTKMGVFGWDPNGPLFGRGG